MSAGRRCQLEVRYHISILLVRLGHKSLSLCKPMIACFGRANFVFWVFLAIHKTSKQPLNLHLAIQGRRTTREKSVMMNSDFLGKLCCDKEQRCPVLDGRGRLNQSGLHCTISLVEQQILYIGVMVPYIAV